jgi:hypothetical protein
LKVFKAFQKIMWDKYILHYVGLGKVQVVCSLNYEKSWWWNPRKRCTKEGIKDQMFEQLNNYFALELRINKVVVVDIEHLCVVWIVKKMLTFKNNVIHSKVGAYNYCCHHTHNT